jgi:hypothetical protein
LFAQKKSEEKRKERSKDSPYFPKGIHSKERFMIQGVPKIFRIRKVMKNST